MFLVRWNKSLLLKLLPSKENSRRVSTTTYKKSFLSRDLSQQFGINLHMFANLSEEKLVLKVLRCNSEILENHSVLEFFNNEALVELSDSLFRNLAPYSTDPRTRKKPMKTLKNWNVPTESFGIVLQPKTLLALQIACIVVSANLQKDYIDLMRKLNIVDEANAALKSRRVCRTCWVLYVRLVTL